MSFPARGGPIWLRYGAVQDRANPSLRSRSARQRLHRAAAGLATGHPQQLRDLIHAADVEIVETIERRLRPYYLSPPRSRSPADLSGVRPSCVHAEEASAQHAPSCCSASLAVAYPAATTGPLDPPERKRSLSIRIATT